MIGLVLAQGMMLVGIGVGLGAAGAVAASRLLSSLLYETATYDLPTSLAVPVMLIVVSLIACYLPARRAATVAPSDALRSE